MNQPLVKPVTSVQPSDGGALLKAASSAQIDMDLQARSNPVAKEKSQAEAKDTAGEANSLANVSIHFRVDDKTNNVTVFLVDRKSKKVLRSIPASELQKLQIGDLLKLTI